MTHRLATTRVAGLLALALLTACGAPAPVAPATTTSAPVTTESTSPGSAAPAGPATGAAEPARCRAANLTLSLDGPTGDGQRQVRLVYTNSSTQPCIARGVPGVDLVGPDDPNGPTYQVLRVGVDVEQASSTIEPGAAATATLTYLTDSPGGFGTSGSTGWVPTELVTTPPGDTEQLTAPWPSGDTVVRQDGATRPGTYVEALSGE